MWRTALIDDEEDARGALKSFISSYCRDLEVCGEADGVQSGVELIRSTRPHLVFLDIQMKDGSGFDLLEKVRQVNFGLIFTTAFDAYAIKAFKYSAIDYLLKPIDPDELADATERAKTQFADRAMQISDLLSYHRGENPERITISSAEGLTLVRLDDIIRLESDSNYTHFFLKDGTRITASRSMKEYEELLPAEKFFRTHQSHIVNMKYVYKFLREDGGYIVMEDGSQAWVARRRKDEFLDRLTGKK